MAAIYQYYDDLANAYTHYSAIYHAGSEEQRLSLPYHTDLWLVLPYTSILILLRLVLTGSLDALLQWVRETFPDTLPSTPTTPLPLNDSNLPSKAHPSSSSSLTYPSPPTSPFTQFAYLRRLGDVFIAPAKPLGTLDPTVRILRVDRFGTCLFKLIYFTIVTLAGWWLIKDEDW